MTSTVAGYCTKCGAPYHAPSVWHGVCPPTYTPTCACWNSPPISTSAGFKIEEGNISTGTAAERQERMENTLRVIEEIACHNLEDNEALSQIYRFAHVAHDPECLESHPEWEKELDEAIHAILRG